MYRAKVILLIVPCVALLYGWIVNEQYMNFNKVTVISLTHKLSLVLKFVNIKVSLLVLFLSLIFSSSCGVPGRNYKFSDVNFKIVKTDNDFLSQRYRISGDTNNNIALMEFDVVYVNGSNGLFRSSIEPGQEGIENKIKTISIYAWDNQNITNKFLGLNFKEQNFRLNENPLRQDPYSQSKDLLSYKNFDDFKESINLKKKYSTGTNIDNPILLSVPDIIIKNPFYFKMYYENGDSLIKRIDLSKDSVPIVQIY